MILYLLIWWAFIFLRSRLIATRWIFARRWRSRWFSCFLVFYPMFWWYSWILWRFSSFLILNSHIILFRWRNLFFIMTNVATILAMDMISARFLGWAIFRFTIWGFSGYKFVLVSFALNSVLNFLSIDLWKIPFAVLFDHIVYIQVWICPPS